MHPAACLYDGRMATKAFDFSFAAAAIAIENKIAAVGIESFDQHQLECACDTSTPPAMLEIVEENRTPNRLASSPPAALPSRSLLEPLPEISLLHGEYSALLSASDMAQLLLGTCKEFRRRFETVDSALLGLLQHRTIGAQTMSSALEVSARCRHQWQHAHHWPESSPLPRQPALARALCWLDEMERAYAFDDFRRAAVAAAAPW